MHRILITGNAGSGKTSVAMALAASLNLPYVGLDSIVWKAGWVRTPRTERREKEMEISQRPSWVVDGVSEIPMQKADFILFSDVPRHRCFYRAFFRNLPYLFSSRPGMPERCPEIRIVPTLVRIIWNFPVTVAPLILAVSHRSDTRFFRAKTQFEIDSAVAAISSAVASTV
ncbi:AAA family ATPase [Rhodanobacter sp. MP7CTX1]|uniref:AAA family ATPase n=1 Tax=Rhodanobacter sp. MP7CTX1 TaxID=2723084 RepID=UPI001616B055|nr:AAA family ATPase [Rhodanobacter sp. MP7CTX1]MBB6186132.1 adenylate kinase family enzyme [Rhodanobacter sp. MP7CTX1]